MYYVIINYYLCFIGFGFILDESDIICYNMYKIMEKTKIWVPYFTSFAMKENFRMPYFTSSGTEENFLMSYFTSSAAKIGKKIVTYFLLQIFSAQKVLLGQQFTLGVFGSPVHLRKSPSTHLLVVW